MAGVGVENAVGTRAVVASRAGVEVRPRTKDGSGADEGEGEGFDLLKGVKSSARLRGLRARDELTFLLDSFSTLIST